jgi:hypothetical protein
MWRPFDSAALSGSHSVDNTALSQFMIGAALCDGRLLIARKPLGFQKETTTDIADGRGFETEEGDGGRTRTLSFRASSVFNLWLFLPAIGNASLYETIRAIRGIRG